MFVKIKKKWLTIYKEYLASLEAKGPKKEVTSESEEAVTQAVKKSYVTSSHQLERIALQLKVILEQGQLAYKPPIHVLVPR